MCVYIYIYTHTHTYVSRYKEIYYKELVLTILKAAMPQPLVSKVEGGPGELMV